MNTKSFSLIAVATLIVCGNVNAQTSTSYYNTRHEIGVSVGSGTMTEIISGLADFTTIGIEAAISTIITGGTTTAYYTYGDEHYTPAISVEYYYHINKVVGLGGYVAYNGMNRDMYYTWRTDGIDHKEYSGKAKRSNLSIIPTAKFDWLRKEHFGLYSKAGIGVSIMHETQKDDKEGRTDYSDTSVIPNIELTFIGMEAGSQTWRGFLEYGLGEQGILSAGLRYKF